MVNTALFKYTVENTRNVMYHAISQNNVIEITLL